MSALGCLDVALADVAGVHDEIRLLIGERTHLVASAGHHAPCFAVFLGQQLARAPAAFAVDYLHAVFGFAQDQRLDFLAVVDEAGKVFDIFVGDGVAVVGVRAQVFDIEPVESHLGQQRVATIVVGHLVGDRCFLVVARLEGGEAHLLVGQLLVSRDDVGHRSPVGFERVLQLFPRHSFPRFPEQANDTKELVCCWGHR